MRNFTNEFLDDLRVVGPLVMSLTEIQEKYSQNEPNKAQIKRELDELIISGRVKRTRVKTFTNGRFLSSTIYEVLIPYTKEEIEIMESENYLFNFNDLVSF